jgi:sulfonate transport system permease protein
MTLTVAADRPAERRVIGLLPVLTNAAYALSLPLVLLLAWQLSSQYGWLPEQILPAPQVVWVTIVDLWSDGTLAEHTLRSLQRVAIGFAIGALLGLLIGTALGLLPRARAFIWPVFTAVAQVNMLAWLPLLVLFVGIDEELKYVSIAWSTAIPVILATTRSIAGVPPQLNELGRVLDFTPLQRVSTIILPAAPPTLYRPSRRIGCGLAKPGDCRAVRLLRRPWLSDHLGSPAIPAGACHSRHAGDRRRRLAAERRARISGTLRPALEDGGPKWPLTSCPSSRFAEPPSIGVRS